MGTIRVRAYLNTAEGSGGLPMGMMFGYEPDHGLMLVLDSTVLATADDIAMCSRVFRLLNIGDDPEFGPVDPRATNYRAAGRRSLSVGDVVQVGRQFYSVDRVGFSQIEAPDPARIATP